MDSSTGAGSVLHVSGGCSVTATRAADSDYNEATSAASAISSISKGNQAAVTLSGVPGTAIVGDTFTASAGGAAVVAATPHAVTGTACTVDSSTGAGSVLHVSGGCSVTATRAADSDYDEATAPASAISSISKGAQAAVTLSGVPGTATVGDTFTAVAGGGSGGGGYAYAVTGTACTVDSSTGARLGAPCERRLFGHSHPGGGQDYNEATSAALAISSISMGAQATLLVTGPTSRPTATPMRRSAPRAAVARACDLRGGRLHGLLDRERQAPRHVGHRRLLDYGDQGCGQ